MPVAHLYAAATPAQQRELLVRGSALYAEVLESPIERIRVYLVEPTAVAVGGEVGTAPYFTAVVLAGRPAGQRAELLRRFTELLVEVLDVPVGEVRGQVVEVRPENWGIGGVPASVVRAAPAGRRT